MIINAGRCKLLEFQLKPAYCVIMCLCNYYRQFSIIYHAGIIMSAGRLKKEWQITSMFIPNFTDKL